MLDRLPASVVRRTGRAIAVDLLTEHGFTGLQWLNRTNRIYAERLGKRYLIDVIARQEDTIDGERNPRYKLPERSARDQIQKSRGLP